MLGKRSRSLCLSLSAAAMAFECAPGECLPQWKMFEKDTLSRCHPPRPSIQVIGFNPKVCCSEEPDEKKRLDRCEKPNLSPKSPRPTFGLEYLLSNSARSPHSEQNSSVQTVELGLVAAMNTDLSQKNQQDRNLRECNCLLQSTSIRADTCPSSKKNVKTMDRPAFSKPIPIFHPPFQQPTSLFPFAGKSYHHLDLLDEQNLSGSTVENMEGSNFLEKGAGVRIVSERSVFTLLASSPGATSVADSASFETMDFMDACFLCKRVLGHGRDIFMYRGDKAFCSAECRHHQIALDEQAERSQKCASAVFKAGNGAQSQRRIHRNRVLSLDTAAAA